MQQAGLQFINEEFFAASVLPDQIDELLSLGWRHFGEQFFRYNVGILDQDIRNVIPLRIRLSQFSLSKSQRRILRRNEDVDVVVKPIEIDQSAEELFDRHKERFDHSVPDSIYNFLSREPSTSPCEGREVRVTKQDELLAASYFDVGKSSTSGIYAIFEPTIADRSLGIFTMLKEIEYSIETGREFYYQGYCYNGTSFYDYKKRFRGTEAFDWNGNWFGVTALAGIGNNEVSGNNGAA